MPVPRGAIIPGSIILGVVAAASQVGVNTLRDSPALTQWPTRLQQGLAGLVPMKSLSDKEYEDLLLDKLIKLEAEISILDEQITNLRAASKQPVSQPAEQANAKR